MLVQSNWHEHVKRDDRGICTYIRFSRDYSTLKLETENINVGTEKGKVLSLINC